MPLMSIDWADSILESDVPISHLATATVDFAIVVMAICPVLATMLLEIDVDRLDLDVNLLGGISNDSSKLLIRQWLMTIRYQNRVFSSFQ